MQKIFFFEKGKKGENSVDNDDHLVQFLFLHLVVIDP